jgi:hypothetical protein
MITSHFTSNQNVFWYFDSVEKLESIYYKAKGWIVVKDGDHFKPVSSLSFNEIEISFERTHRPDVQDYYPGKDTQVGVEFIFRAGQDVTVHFGDFKYNCGKIDNYIAFHSGFANENKGLIVVDNFYANPDFVRDFAMKNLDFSPSNYHKGKRSTERFILEGTKEKLEKIIGREIINWNYERYANGVFQYCVANDPLVFHVDTQNYAGMVFLTKDAPFDTGTSTYSSKITGRKRFDDASLDEEAYVASFKGKNAEMNFYDSTHFDKIDEVGNVYNRLVLFDAKQIHAPSKYFGDAIENARFFHMFFFDVI